MRQSAFDPKLFLEAVDRYEEGLPLTADMKVTLVEGLRREAIAMEAREKRAEQHKVFSQWQTKFEREYREKWAPLLEKIRSGEYKPLDLFGP